MPAPPVKCVVWDLDDVVWHGCLLEGDRGELRPSVRETLAALDRRGVLHSIASASDRDAALARLGELGLAHYFLHPQIELAADKPLQIETIARKLGFSLDQVAFIDDSAHQRAYVAQALPEVWVLCADAVAGLPQDPRFPRHGTAESARRRALYRADADRQAEERAFGGRRAAFLASCALVARVREAGAEDAPRVAELVERTHRLQAAAHRYTLAEIEAAIDRPATHVVVAQLRDRFGDHGLVGAAIIEAFDRDWRVGALVVSCRVQGLGVGDSLLVRALELAAAHGARALGIEYPQSPRNRPITLLLARYGFERRGRKGRLARLEHDLDTLPALPAWLELQRA